MRCHNSEQHLSRMILFPNNTFFLADFVNSFCEFLVRLKKKKNSKAVVFCQVSPRAFVTRQHKMPINSGEVGSSWAGNSKLIRESLCMFNVFYGSVTFPQGVMKNERNSLDDLSCECKYGALVLPTTGQLQRIIGFYLNRFKICLQERILNVNNLCLSNSKFGILKLCSLSGEFLWL